MSSLRLRWRYFWSRRSRRRTSLALLLLFVSLLAITYVAIPAAWQLRVQDGLLAIGRGIRSLGLTNELIAGVSLCLVVSLLLIFLPTYRRHGYLTTDRHIIPPVSVYLDAENQLLTEADILLFFDHLRTLLKGRRVDLLYFLDASRDATTDRYKNLFRYGFRPIDVPHDPTGKGEVKEAVDRELAMHAYERALLGPLEQEFIIVSGDGDFVPLIYRLVALGHRVELCARQIPDRYDVVKRYLGIELFDLADIHPVLESVSRHALTPLPDSASGQRASPQTLQLINQFRASDSVRSVIIASGEERLSKAIDETISAIAQARTQSRTAEQVKGNFYSFLTERLRAQLSSAGYDAGSWIEYWLSHLVAVGVLSKEAGRYVSRQREGDHKLAAHKLMEMAERAARAAVFVGGFHGDDVVRMGEITAALALEKPQNAGDVGVLLTFVANGNKQRITHTRYFVRCARALGLLDFGDVGRDLDAIRNPRPSFGATAELSAVALAAEVPPREPEVQTRIPAIQQVEGAGFAVPPTDASPAADASHEASNPPTAI